MSITYLIISYVTAFCIMYMISFFEEKRDVKMIAASAGAIWVLNIVISHFEMGRGVGILLLGCTMIGLLFQVFKFEPVPAIVGSILYVFLYKTLLYILITYVFFFLL